MCGDSGVLSRERVIAALLRNQVDVYLREDGDEHEYVIAGDSIREVQVLPAALPRRFIHYLSRRFGVEVHLLYRSS